MTTTQLEKKPLINLWGINGGIGLIIPHPSGVIYSNQTAGLLTDHPREEGVFIPLSGDRENELWGELRQHFGMRGKWRSGCADGIDEETAGFLDGLFERGRWTKSIGLQVDRDHLKDCQEAWIHVTFREPDPLNPDQALLKGFEYIDGIFTWQNSD